MKAKYLISMGNQVISKKSLTDSGLSYKPFQGSIEMEKLFCYGITQRALAMLQRQNGRATKVPNAWFNWTLDALDRLSVLDVEQGFDAVIAWCRAAQDAGLGCVLVYSTEDEPAHTDHAPNLPGDLVIHPINHVAQEDECRDQEDLLELLREPENFFFVAWMCISWGGENLAAQDLHAIPIEHWWAYGQGLRRWMLATAKGQEGEGERRLYPDCSVWNNMRAVLPDHPDTHLDAQWYWGTSATASWPWSLRNPCTVHDIPALAQDSLIAYYPMRHMPCCGVAVTRQGECLPCGALTSDWAWAGEGTQKTFADLALALVAKENDPMQGKILIFNVMLFKASDAANHTQFRAAASHRQTAPAVESSVVWTQSVDGQVSTWQLRTQDTAVFLENAGKLTNEPGEKAAIPPQELRDLAGTPPLAWTLVADGPRWRVKGLTALMFNKRMQGIFAENASAHVQFSEQGYCVC